MPYHSIEFVRLVSNTAIVRECYPVPTTYFLEPVLIRGRICEMVNVAFYCEATVAEDLGELLPEISIREKKRSSGPLVHDGLLNFFRTKIIVGGYVIDGFASVNPIDYCRG